MDFIESSELTILDIEGSFIKDLYSMNNIDTEDYI